MLADLVAPAHVDLPTPCLQFADIGRREPDADERRHAHCRREHVDIALPIIFAGKLQAVAQQVHV